MCPRLCVAKWCLPFAGGGVLSISVRVLEAVSSRELEVTHRTESPLPSSGSITVHIWRCIVGARIATIKPEYLMAEKFFTDVPSTVEFKGVDSTDL